MKQLSIEEKAKRYDKILARAEGANLPYYKEEIMSKVKEFVEYLLPELKESEDERIRKAIVEFFELQDDNTTYSFIPKKDILAWLKKQGELVNSLSKGLDNSHERIDGLIQKNNSLIEQLEKQGEQKPAEQIENFDVTSFDKEYNKFCKKNKIKTDDNSYKIAIHFAYWQKSFNYENDNIQQKNFAPNQEQSEEDDIMIAVLAAYEEMAISNGCPNDAERISNAIDKLKSLRHQNTWKPSEEQMNALDSTLQYSQVSHNSFEHLNSLFNDLKKLKG